MTNAFDDWDFDLLGCKHWDFDRDDRRVSIERSGDVYWSFFDQNPARFPCTDATCQGIEEFLRDGPPAQSAGRMLDINAELTAASDALRRHLLGCRRPGRSSIAVMCVRAPSLLRDKLGRDRLNERWFVDGELLFPDLAGPRIGNLIFDPAPQRWWPDQESLWKRILLAPGRHALKLEVHHKGERVAIDAEVEVERARTCRVTFELVDPQAAWTVRIEPAR